MDLILFSDLNDVASENGLSNCQFKKIILSSAAQTHRLRKLRGPSKCRECENFMVSGIECEEVSEHKGTTSLQNGQTASHSQYNI